MMPRVVKAAEGIPARSFLERFSPAWALLGVLAFWGGMLMAVQRFPDAYDWRDRPVSNLVSPDRNPGYLWAATGLVLCGLCGLCWAAGMAKCRTHESVGYRPGGFRALQFGNLALICEGVLTKWLLRIHKGHEFLAVLAFAGLLFGMVRLMFHTVERTLLGRMGGFTGRARLYAFIAAGIAVLPVLLAGLAQAYFYYVPPELHWISFAWRVHGWPVLLRFPFWEWVTCAVLSAYMVILALAAPAGCPKEGGTGR